jgi:hypothetical protein
VNASRIDHLNIALFAIGDPQLGERARKLNSIAFREFKNLGLVHRDPV